MTTPTQRLRSVFGVERLEGREAPAVDLRVVSYNIAAADGVVRSGLDSILQWIGNQAAAGVARPIDVLAIQETDNNSSGTAATADVVALLNGLYGAGTYARGTLNGGSTGSGTQGVVYRVSTVDLVGETVVGTLSTGGAARQPVRYQFRPDGFAAGEADFYLYNAHMKANDTDTDEARRRVEAGQIRANADALPPTADVLYAGDFNLYGSDPGGAYQRFFDAGNGRAIDPANPARDWANNSSAWVTLYSQAPLQSPPSGLTGGGLDDRFDYLLASEDLSGASPAGLEYRLGTYRVFGNNGSVPVNGNINSTSNTALNFIADSATRTAVRNYLTTVTDHLPVVADFTVATGRMQFTTTSYSVDETAGTATITVSRVGGSTGTATVNYAATAGTAVAGVHFTPVSGTLTFAHGVTSRTFAVPILNDNAASGNKTVNLALSLPANSPADLGSPAAAVLTILDAGVPPAVESVVVNAGQADLVQRSRVTSLQVTFSTAVSVSAANFAVSNFAGTLSVSTQAVGGRTVATVTFGGTGTEFGSLADGRYTLTVSGVPGLTGPTSFDFHRLFGDRDGDADTDTIDLARFRLAFGSVSGDAAYFAGFDFDDDGDVDTIDLARFRQRFGVALP